jgi:hypothetical protein
MLSIFSEDTKAFTMTEPYRHTASEAVALMKKGDLTVEDHAKALLPRVKERDHVIT